MRHHKYYNTIWTERDQEFWWDGIKSGFIIATILTTAIIADGAMFVQWVTKLRKKEL